MRRLKSNMTQQLCFAATLVALAALLSATVTAEPMNAIKGQDSTVIHGDQNAAEIRKTLAADDGSIGSCSCYKDTCTCCAYVNIFTSYKRGCVKITYIPSNLVLSIAVTLNGRSLYQTQRKAQDPQSTCFPARYMSKYARLCLYFYDITWKKHVGGCVRLTVNFTKSFQMGCYNFNHLDEKSKMAFSRILHKLKQIQILRNHAELKKKKLDHLIL